MASNAARTMGKDGHHPSLPISAIPCQVMDPSETNPPRGAAKVRPAHRTRTPSPARVVRLPRMGLHKSSGQARVVLSGVEHYLGVWGTAESHARYAALVKQWLADDKRPQHRAPTAGGGA